MEAQILDKDQISEAMKSSFSSVLCAIYYLLHDGTNTAST